MSERFSVSKSHGLKGNLDVDLLELQSNAAS